MAGRVRFGPRHSICIACLARHALSPLFLSVKLSTIAVTYLPFSIQMSEPCTTLVAA
jgi:hypothetical protein